MDVYERALLNAPAGAAAVLRVELGMALEGRTQPPSFEGFLRPRKSPELEGQFRDSGSSRCVFTAVLVSRIRSSRVVV